MWIGAPPSNTRTGFQVRMVSLKTIPSAITVPSPNLREHITAVPVECVYWIWIITVLLELCRRSESSALHSFSNFSYIQHNLRNSDVCIYEFPYMASIEVQTARTLDHFQHGSGDVGKQGRSCGIVKLSNGTAGKRVGFNLSFHCQHIGGDKFKRTAMAATVFHIRRANIPQPFEFTGRGSCERKRLPESIALLRVSVFDVEILAHSAEFAKETQDVNIFVVTGCGVISFLNFIKNCNIAGNLGVLNNGISVANFCYGRCRARFDSIVFSHVFS
ncbi:hypothetical protein Gotri_011187 [Gossypium trilobum]|uniref:Uncharacterized protein n=1 Tax=Gossypium trilobum TaxID=34281 RepID=A0A7J9EUI4_9ROSI|nr:hypothetical protein [Gossypium trilobum]